MVVRSVMNGIMKKLLFSVGLSLLLLQVEVEGQQCPYQWINGPDGKTCYFFSFLSSTYMWQDARIRCQAFQGTLLRINSVQERTFVTNTINQLHRTYSTATIFWTSLHKVANKGWLWGDGSQANTQYISWAPGQPPKDNKSYCTYIKFPANQMVTAPCGTWSHYICERDRGLPLMCDTDNGWHNLNGYCFKSYNITRSWKQAEQHCQMDNAHLTSVQNKDIQGFVWDMGTEMHHPIWTGLHTVVQNNAASWEWIDGLQLDISNVFWETAPGALGPSDNNTCMYMNPNARRLHSWYPAPCDQARSFVCSKPQGVCPAGWLTHQGNCFEFNPRSKLSWNDANTFCQSQGGQLAKISSSSDTQFINVYLGVQAGAGVTSIWIGAADDQSNNNYVWSDSSAISGYTNWAVSPVKNTPNHRDCIYINTRDHNGKWQVSSDCTTSRSFLCMMAVGTTLKASNKTMARYICDPGWQLYQSTCFQFNDNDQNWTDARATCQAEGGDLAVIAGDPAQSFINNHVANGDYWIGLSDTAGQGQFSWLDTKNTTGYAHWDANEPKRSTPNHDCVVVIGTSGSGNNGKWRGSPCNNRKNFICQKGASLYQCDAGWEVFGNQCYQFNKDSKQWTDARSACQIQGGDLTIIDSNAQQAFLNQHVQNLDYWIGLNDRTKEGTFGWLDSTNPTVYKNWNKGEPNNVNDENCVAILGAATSSENGKWNDYACSRTYGYICQKPTNYFACEYGWRVFGNQCYQFSSTTKSWPDARADCRNSGGDLAVINGDPLQNYLNKYVRSGDFWIGLNDNNHEGTFAWLDSTTPTAYKHWNDHEPNNQGDENCVAIYGTRDSTQNGRWNDYACSRTFNYICQKPTKNATSSFTMAPVWSQKCGAFWEESKGSDYCYQFRDEQLTWQDAQDTCRHHGGNLASIVSMPEQFYITGRMQTATSTAMWIGLSDTKAEAKFTWIDDQPLAYLNWAPSEPNNYRNNEDCAAIYATNTRWNDFPCSNRNGFICKKLGTVTRTTVPPTTSPATVPAGKTYGCPSGWTGFRGSCYKLVRQAITWPKSQEACHQAGAELASITDKPENDFITSLLPSGTSGYWIGLTDKQIQMRFVWTDGSPVSYTNWSPYEPNNYGSSHEDCVEFYRGEWNDNSCGKQRTGYVCKRPKYIMASTGPDPRKVGCSKGLGYGPFCYFHGSTLRTFQDAENDCKRNHGHLATVNDRFVQSFLTSELSLQKTNAWIGLSDSRAPRYYQWTSGARLRYTNWDKSHTGREMRTCVAMRPDIPVGLWRNLPCTQKNAYICEVHRSGYATTPSPTPISARRYCYYGWYEFQNLCYKPFYSTSFRKTWVEARDYCRAQGGDLMSIHNATMNTFIRSRFSRYRYTFWIGLNDRDRERSYVWSDGSPYQYAHWRPGEPNDGKGREDCVEMTPSTQLWNDNNCNLANYFICQAPKNLTSPRVNPTVPVTLAPPQKCPVDSRFLTYKGWCYYIAPMYGTYASKSWYSARQYCQSLKADLVSIRSRDENDFILTQISKRTPSSVPYWIGLNELGRNGYKWTDGTPTTFVSWATNEPNDANGGERCVAMHSALGDWKDENCGTRHSFVCKKSNSSTSPQPPVPTPLIQGGCPTSFSDVGNKCYFVGGKTVGGRLTWTQARDKCKAMGKKVELASVNSAVEDAFVVTLMRGMVSPMWIGLNDMVRNMQFTWQDNSEVKFTHWAAGQPQETRKVINHRYTTIREDCVAMAPPTNMAAGAWSDEVCTQKYAYLCQVMKDVTIPTPPSQSPQCRTGYTAFNNNCYKLYTTPANFQDAIVKCAQDTGNLVSQVDVYEYAFVRVLTYKQKFDKPFWIGLSDSKYKGVYGWADGWPVKLTYWDKGEPSRGDGEGCVAQHNGKWNDTVCSQQLAFMCKISSATPPPTPSGHPGYCENSQATAHGNQCYYANPYVLKSWPEAGYMCRTMGMQLATVHSKTDNDFLKQLVSTAPPPTSRYHTTYRPRKYNMWIGMTKSFGGGFRWEDKQPVNFMYWMPGQPSDSSSRTHEECVEMNVVSFQWNDLDCMQKRGYICQASKMYPTQTPASSPTPTAKQATTTQKGTATLAPKQTTTTPKRVTNTPRPTNRIVTPRPRTQAPFPTPKVPVIRNAPITGSNNQVNMSGGEIAGVIIGVLAFLALVSVLAVVYRRRLRERVPFFAYPETGSGFENALYNTSNETVNVQADDNGQGKKYMHLGGANEGGTEDC